MARLERDDSKATNADLDALIELEEKLESKLPPAATIIWALTTRLPNQNTSPTGTPRTEETHPIGFDAISAGSS